MRPDVQSTVKYFFNLWRIVKFLRSNIKNNDNSVLKRQVITFKTKVYVPKLLKLKRMNNFFYIMYIFLIKTNIYYDICIDLWVKLDENDSETIKILDSAF